MLPGVQKMELFEEAFIQIMKTKLVVRHAEIYITFIVQITPQGICFSFHHTTRVVTLRWCFLIQVNSVLQLFALFIFLQIPVIFSWVFQDGI